MTKDHLKYEKEIRKFWQENQIYNKVQEKNSKADSFHHVDGPPYPTGEIHVGHLRNWSIKDSVLRFKRLQGYNVYARDGYDVHGLPVENKVQKKLNLDTVDKIKEFGESNFVKECKKYVDEIIMAMIERREAFGLWMDRDHYQTSHPEYISMAWQFFRKADEKGLLYKDYKTVAWCPHDETTLADYEIKDEYKVLKDPSIYVKFPLKKEFTTTGFNESLVIWTTTPWTLQSNMAIAVHADFDYAKVLVKIDGEEEVLIIAEALAESLIQKLKKQIDIEFVKIVETLKGSELEGVKYNHIYIEETPSQQEFMKQDIKNLHSVILADFVTLGEGEDILEKLEKKGYKHEGDKKDKVEEKKSKVEGSGLVHIAPGHGFEDYETGKKYNLPVFCPVDKQGKFDEGKYEGMYFKDVDPVAIDYLKVKGFLLYSDKKEHRYPCCWRCKTPIVYRAADQWWIKRSDYIKDIIKENKNVKWHPKFAAESFENLMQGAGDWAISRQRFWGIPLPIFEDEDGNYEVFGSKEELEQRIGKKLEDLHRDDVDDLEIINKKSGKVMKRVPFTADVWFDSGCASFASHYGEGLSFDEILEKYYPIKWITESEDQIRGWFSSLFNVGHIVTGKAPYNEVLFYAFVMAKDGSKMSKSLGNGVDGIEALELWGADRTRYYLLSKKVPEEKINFDRGELEIVEGVFNTLENSVKFANSYLEEYNVGNFPTYNFQSLRVEDKWILYKLNLTLQNYTNYMENFRMNFAIREVEEFLIKDFSKTYLKIVKDRTDGRDDDLLVILSEIVREVLVMLSPIMPFKTEELYRQVTLPNKKESIFLEAMPLYDEFMISEVKKREIPDHFDLAQEIVQAILNSREKAKIGVRWPLGEVDLVSSQDLKPKLEQFEQLIKHLTNIGRIVYDLDDVEVEYIVKPNFATLKHDFTDVKEAIKAVNMNKFHIAKDIKAGLSGGTYEGVTLDFEKHIIKDIELKGELTASDFSLGSVILHTHQDDILLEGGYLRELIRRVQDFRKDLNMHKSEVITLSFDGSDDYFLELTENWEGVIKGKVGAQDVVLTSLGNKQEFEIKDKKLVVSLEKIN